MHYFLLKINLFIHIYLINTNLLLVVLYSISRNARGEINLSFVVTNHFAWPTIFLARPLQDSSVNQIICISCSAYDVCCCCCLDAWMNLFSAPLDPLSPSFTSFTHSIFIRSVSVWSWILFTVALHIICRTEHYAFSHQLFHNNHM